MKTEVETERTIRLTLTETEARWLLAYLQNYPGSNQEPDNSFDMRKALFDALQPVL